jgi:hypothetical protein
VDEEIKMSTYIRRTPGRLRTNFPQLKNNPGQAEAAEAAIRQIAGVVSVKASTFTGNLFIHYDASCIGVNMLLESVQHTKQRLGLTHIAPRPPRPVYVPRRSLATPAPEVSRASTDKLNHMLLGLLIEKCIEHSAITVVAALL